MDTPGCPAATVERRRNVDDPGVYRMTPHETSPGLPRDPNHIQFYRSTHHRDETQLPDKGSGEQQETDNPPGPLWTTDQPPAEPGSYQQRWVTSITPARALPETSEALTRHPPTPSMDEETRPLSHNDRHARRLNHRTRRRSHARSSVEVTNRGHHRRKGTNVPKYLFQFTIHIRLHGQGHHPMFISRRRTSRDWLFIFEISPWIDLWSHNSGQIKLSKSPPPPNDWDIRAQYVLGPG